MKDTSLATLWDAGLDKQAHEKDHRHVHWFSRRGGSSRRVWYCNLCGEEIDRESAKYPVTHHVWEAIRVHRELHIQEAKNERPGTARGAAREDAGR